MRTSLNEIKRCEDFLQHSLSGEESALFQSQLILDPTLRVNVGVQKMLYKIVRDFGRRSNKKNIDKFHNRIFSDPSKQMFQESIYREFKNQ